MRLLQILFLISSATAIAFPPLPARTSSPTLVQRDESITSIPASTPAPTGDSRVYFTTKFVTVPGVTNQAVTIAEKTITLKLPTCHHTIAPDSNGYRPPGTCGALFAYYPSFFAAVVMTAIFGILAAVHIFLAVKHKAGYCWVLIMGTIWDMMAFLIRSISTKHQEVSGIVLTSSIFILLAPLLINAHSYITLARLIETYLPRKSLVGIKAHHFSLLFVTLDIVSFIIQLVGGSWAGPSVPPDEQLKGIHIYMGGIGLQQFFIFVFVALAIKFHREMNKVDPNQHQGLWRKLVYAIYISLAFITVRIIFRLIQFSSGSTATSSILISKEMWLYILEAAPMVCSILVFVIIHPGRIVQKNMPSILSGLRNRLPGKKSKGPKDPMKITLITETGMRSDYAELEPYGYSKGGV